MNAGVHHVSLPPSVPRQDVFLMIRRQKTTIFTDAKESTTVYELKRIVEGILKRSPEEQRLYKVRPGVSRADMDGHHLHRLLAAINTSPFWCLLSCFSR